MIGGEKSHEKVGDEMLPSNPCALSESTRRVLWNVVVHIGRAWGITSCEAEETASAFRECVHLKCEEVPSYSAEYDNAVVVLDELIEMYGEESAYQQLFFSPGIEEEDHDTRLAHLKEYVVDQLISLVVVVVGFRAFGAHNHAGYIGGSRFRRVPPYRVPPEDS